jgi:L-aminopeptidase/D-esterase-like protein
MTRPSASRADVVTSAASVTAGPEAVDGLLIGHYERRTRGWRTGTTVVLAPGGATAGVDVRGGGPGTRETDLLRPENLVQQVHAVCLTGGSAFGLAAADGVMEWLAAEGIGFPVGPEVGHVVPIVPTAVIFDLGRGGDFQQRPDATFGTHACERAKKGRGHRPGAFGAGTGALAGGLQGGVGHAMARLADGTMISAIAVVNAAGSVIDPGSGLPHVGAADLGLRRPPATERRALRDHLATLQRPLNTTIGVVATTATLTKSECTKLAQTSHDGLARAARPAHTMFDGDVIFALATGSDALVNLPGDERFRAPSSRAAWLNTLLVAGADCFALAVAHGVVAAEGRGPSPTYRSLCPGAFDVVESRADS